MFPQLSKSHTSLAYRNSFPRDCVTLVPGVVTIAAVLVLVLVLGDKVFGEMISSYRLSETTVPCTAGVVVNHVRPLIPLAVGGQTAKPAPATGPLVGRQRRGSAESECDK
jgi:hypothetical protein